MAELTPNVTMVLPEPAYSRTHRRVQAQFMRRSAAESNLGRGDSIAGNRKLAGPIGPQSRDMDFIASPFERARARKEGTLPRHDSIGLPRTNGRKCKNLAISLLLDGAEKPCDAGCFHGPDWLFTRTAQFLFSQADHVGPPRLATEIQQGQRHGQVEALRAGAAGIEVSHSISHALFRLVGMPADHKIKFSRFRT
jgi:hypothetical protein